MFVIIDYSFTIKPHGIPKLAKIIGCEYLVSQNLPGVGVSAELLDYSVYLGAGIRLLSDKGGMFYEFYVKFQDKIYASKSVDFDKVEVLLGNLKINSKEMRLERGSKVFVGMGGWNG